MSVLAIGPADAAEAISVLDEDKLLPILGQDGILLGGAVAMDGDTAIVSATGNDDDGMDAGAAYAYIHDASDGWRLQGRLMPTDGAAFDGFGGAVAVSGDTAVIAASLDDDLGGGSGSVYVFTRSGNTWAQQAKLTASDGVAGDAFGAPLTMDGDTVVVGHSSDDDLGADAGAAYVFTRTGTTWTQQAKLTAGDGASGDGFGAAVAVHGDTLTAGAPNDSTTFGRAGSAYVYTRIGSTWSEQAKLTAGDPFAWEFFGSSVAIDGETVAVGTPDDNPTGGGSTTLAGSAYVFTRTGATWSQQAKLFADDAAFVDHFGSSIDVAGNTVLIGSPGDDNVATDAGSAYVFTRAGTSWTQQAKVMASDGAAGEGLGRALAVDAERVVVGVPSHDHFGTDVGTAFFFERSGAAWTQVAEVEAGDGAPSDEFGCAVAVDGDTLVAGSPFDDDLGSGSGSAYVFVRAGPAWVQQAKLRAADGAASDQFGWSVALEDDTLVVGAPADDDVGVDSGAVYVFTRVGSTWTQQAKLTADDGAAGDRFGLSLAIDGDTIAVGAPSDDGSDPDDGSTYVFTGTGSTWSQQARLVAADGAASDEFGWSVDVDGGSVVVGARSDDDLGSGSGSAYVFGRSGATWAQQAKLTASDGAALDEFGGSVAIDDDVVLVGAPLDDGAVQDAGSAYVFTRAAADWVEQVRIARPDAAASDEFGRSVALQGPRALVGSPPSDGQGTDSGSAYLFSRVGSTWSQALEITASDGRPGGLFGRSVALDAATVALGAPGASPQGSASGAAYAVRLAIPPLAAFSFAPAPPTTQDGIAFTDLSLAGDSAITSWYWDFGDGTSSSEGHATHAYANDGVYSVRLTVTDADGDTDAADQVVAVLNAPPTASFSFGPARPTAGKSVQFTDDSTDSDGRISAWTWDFGDGVSSVEQHPDHIYPGDGTYVATFTVADDDGATATTTRTIHVFNKAPTAAFSHSPATPAPGEVVSFRDASVDSDGAMVSWAWAFGDGESSMEEDNTHAFAVDGVYAVTLTVTDDGGASATASRDILVSSTRQNEAPVASFSFSPEFPTPTESVSFRDASADPDGAVVSRQWLFGDGSASDLADPTHSFALPGVYSVTLIVEDEEGAHAAMTAEVRVRNSPPNAAFSFGPGMPSVDGPVSFLDASTDLDGSIVARAWSFGDGATSTQRDPTHSYGATGEYTVTLMVTDDANDTSSASRTITVRNEPPAAALSVSPARPTTQDPVQFFDASTDVDGAVVAWSWNFGDGTTSSVQHPTHQYADDGYYTVSLAVTDNHGAHGTTSTMLSVLNAPPTAAFDPGPGPADAFTTLQFADQSADPDGTVVRWRWDFGDGFQSTEQNPQHRYQECGSYQVRLDIEDDDGDTGHALGVVDVHLLHVGGGQVVPCPL